MTRRVIFSIEALDDLRRLADRIADQAGVGVADRYTERLRTFCRRPDLFPERGSRRDDVSVGLRVIGFERRVAVAFRVGEQEVVIARLLYGGRDLDSILNSGAD